MPTVNLSIPELGVTKKGREREKEIYVLGFVADGRGEGSCGSQPKTEFNEDLLSVRPDLGDAALEKVVSITASRIFHRIRHDQPVSLTGDGISLYRESDPKGFLEAHFVVVESDAESRGLASVLKKLGKHQALKDAANAALPALGGPNYALLVTNGFNLLTKVVSKVLKRNRDDPLLQHTHSGSLTNNYGLSKRSAGVKTEKDFPIKNDRAFATLRLRVSWNAVEQG